MNDCTGTISSLAGEYVLFTGKAVVNGKHVKREVLQALTRGAGGEAVPDRSSSITILVIGETWSGPLHDERRRYSQKASFVEELGSAAGHHVHVIDAEGFGNLLRGQPAHCFTLRPPA